MVDQVLEKIKYNDCDLYNLTSHRPELTEFHENFFKVIDRIKEPKNQDWIVSESVLGLFNAGKYDSVISLINALGRRLFNGRSLRDAAIQWAFFQGTLRGMKNILWRSCMNIQQSHLRNTPEN